MEDKAKELLEQKKEYDEEKSGQLKQFVENQVEGKSGNLLEDAETMEDQRLEHQNRTIDQQNRMKSQEHRGSNHTAMPTTDRKG
ncbi:hypothetical protein [Saccharibacillus kuerlensis]|uniref:Uncharacterized protein n=1 Tax=Saccharibacillus kuerlensis TaxID=459527 RepID=A0ABQ2KTT4_9BACL|nr:hypothetical protein [Saccharibacillus kuerlensis]GGN92701.1 hypothetical protein GCM10010969_05500 [Saccharibacillus kuerlensis]